MKIVVLAGGTSTERDVSLVSGKNVYQALRAKGHQVILLDVYLGYENTTENIFEQDVDWIAQIGSISEECPDLEAVKALRKDGEKNFFGPNVLTICQEADVSTPSSTAFAASSVACPGLWVISMATSYFVVSILPNIDSHTLAFDVRPDIGFTIAKRRIGFLLSKLSFVLRSLIVMCIDRCIATSVLISILAR